MFDTKSFLKAKMVPRTEDVAVPDMAAFFPEGEKPFWTVRGLTGQELGRANEAAAKNKVIGATLDAISNLSAKEQVQEIKKSLGIGGGVTDDVAKRIEYLTLGSVKPAITQDVAVKLCETFPAEFYELTNAIVRLTGKGHEAKKSKPSGETTESASA
jgi:hypothetical protein